MYHCYPSSDSVSGTGVPGAPDDYGTRKGCTRVQ